MSNTPKIRFDGFTGVWEQRKVVRYYCYECTKWITCITSRVCFGTTGRYDLITSENV